MAFDAGSVIGRLELGLEGWKKSVEAVKKDQQSMTGFAMRHKDEIEKLGRTFTIVGGAIVGAFGLMIKGGADYGDKMDELAQRTGAGIEILSGLDGTLRKNGASVEDLGLGMKTLSGRMVDANNGNKDAIALFDSLGIKVTDANGKLRSTTDVLFDVADRFKGTRDGAEKTTAAVDLLGKGGMALIPTLNLGADGLRREADEAQRLGKVLTKEAGKAASDFNDALQNTQDAVAGATMSIGQLLMPTVQKIAEAVKDVVVKFKDWVKENPVLAGVLAKVAGAAGGLMLVLGPILIILPKLAAGFTLLAAHPVVAAIIALGAALTITAGAMKMMSDATDRQIKMDREINKQQGDLWQNLFDAAAQCGVTGKAWEDLTKKYDLNAVAMATAILNGDEVAISQEALNSKMTESKKVMELKKKADEDAAAAMKGDLLPALGGVTTAAKTLKEELDLLFLSDLRDKIKKTEDALKLYKGQLAPETEKQLREELAKLQAQFLTAVPPARDMGRILAGVSDEMDGTAYYSHDLDGEIEKLSDDMMVSANSIKLAGYEIMRLQAFLNLGIVLPDLRIPIEPIKENVKGFSDVWAGAFSHLTQAFGDTFQSFVETWSWDKLVNGKINFKEFFKDIWGNIKETFFTLVGDLAAKWVTDFLEKALLKKTAEAAAGAAGSIISNIGDVAGAGAKAVTGAATSVIDTVSGVVTAITGVLDLLKGPQKQTDVTYWLKLIKDLTQEIRDSWFVVFNWLLTEVWPHIYTTSNAAVDSVGVLHGIESRLWETQDILKGFFTLGEDIRNKISDVVAAIGGLGGAEEGRVSTRSELVMVHGSPEVPEYIIPKNKLPLFSAPLEAAGPTRNVNISLSASFNISALDGPSVRDLVRSQIGPQFVEWVRANLGKTVLKEALGV